MATRHHHRHTHTARANSTPYQHRHQYDDHRNQNPRFKDNSTPTSSSFTASGQPILAPSAPVRVNYSADSFTAKNNTNSRRSATTNSKGVKSGVSSQLDDLDQDVDDTPVDSNGAPVFETDPRRLEQRQKQLELGYSTPEYKAYRLKVKISDRVRDRRFVDHPVTPNKRYACSKRSWDGQIRKWRRLLHAYDADAATHMEATIEPVPPVESTQTINPSNANSIDSSHIASLAHFPAISNSPIIPTAPAASSTIPTQGATVIQSSVSTVPTPAPVLAPTPVPSNPPALSAAPLQTTSTISITSTTALTSTSAASSVVSGPSVLFRTALPLSTAVPVYNDRLASFDEDELALIPPEIASTNEANKVGTEANIDEDELLDYDEEEMAELEMQQAALEAAKAFM